MSIEEKKTTIIKQLFGYTDQNTEEDEEQELTDNLSLGPIKIMFAIIDAWKKIRDGFQKHFSWIGPAYQRFRKDEQKDHNRF